MIPPARPPLVVAWLFRRLFSDREIFSTSGDLEEIFLAEVESRGLSRARRWYWGQLFKAIPHRLLAVFLLDIPMFLLSLKVMVRSFRRQRLFMALSMLALTLGLTCFFLIFLYIRYESSYDSFHPDAGRIFRLMLEDPPGAREKVPGPFAHALERDIPEIEASVQTCRGFSPIVKIGKDKLETEALFAADDFLRLFRFPLLRGREQALSEPGQVVLTERAARRFFGSEDPLGRVMDLSIRGENCRLMVSGLMADPPSNTHFVFDLLISMPTVQALPGYRKMLEFWKNRFPQTYIKLRRTAASASASGKIAAVLGRSAEKAEAGRDSIRASLQPISDIHLRPDGKNPVAIRTLTLFFLLSLLILAVAVINYVNLATSRSGARRQEVGVRKTIGAGRGHLIRQFLGEAVVLTSVSFVSSLAALALLLPGFNRVMERDLRLERLFQMTGGLEVAGLLLAVGIVAGIYPALHLSSFQPARILKGSTAGRNLAVRSRNVLLVVQFAAAVVLVVLSLSIRGQVRFALTGDPGFDKRGVVEAWAFPPEGEPAKLRLLQDPRVEGVTLISNQIALSNRGPLNESWGKLAVLRDSAWEPLSGGIFHLRCDADFVPVFNLRLTAGRNFSSSSDERSAAIINETLAGRLGPGDPVGKRIRVINENSGEDKELMIIGVIKDFHFQPLHAAIGPIVLTQTSDNYAMVYAKFGDVSAGEALSVVKGVLDQFFPEESHAPEFLEDRLASFYQAEAKQASLMSFFSVLAVIIAALSVFGLAGFAVERRTREIGIRKILGARTRRLFLLLSGDFAALLAVSFALGSPLAFYFVNRWLSNFAYHVPVRAGTFVLAAAGMLVMTLLATGTQIFRVFRIDPVDVIKQE